MSPDASLFVSGVSTSIIGTAAFALLLPLLRNRQLLDIPNHRSSHATPTVRGGGLGIMVALVCGLAIGATIPHLAGEALRIVIWFGVAVAAFAALGWAEDVRGLSVRNRLGGQALISVSAMLGATMLSDLPVVLAAFAAAGGVFYVNAANFMDGVNGISAWHGTVIGAYFAALGYMSDSLGLTLAGVVTAAAFLSFLPWNAPRARMFMGDVGSYALGAAAWALCVLTVAVGTPFLVAVAPLVVYAGDVVFTLIRRAGRRATLFDAHREHTYQKVQQITGSHGASTGVVTSATVACAVVGLMGIQLPDVAPWAIAAATVILASYLVSPVLLTIRLRNRATGDRR
ncbi:MAG: glycosyltransferase family 4 protein [Actinobacteria bacterium]|nr:glycosyltransferase family 4 protein [Actinomycetota bacterium]